MTPYWSQRTWLGTILRSRTVIIVAVFMALVGVLMTPIGHMPISLIKLIWQSGAGPFDRPALVALIEKAKSLHLPHGEVVLLRWNDLYHPDSLHVVTISSPMTPMKDKRDYYPNMRVRVIDDAHMQVNITTNEMGHAGAYGFAYSDELLPASTSEFSSGQIIYIVDGQEFVKRQIDDHWWEIYAGD